MSKKIDRTDHSANVEDSLEMEIDKNNNFDDIRNGDVFSKHYKISKKPDLRVKFKSDLVECKPGTILKTEVYVPDTLENDTDIIRKCTTIEDINRQSDILLEQLKDLKYKKVKLGYDVSYEFDNLKIKLELVKDMREKVLKEINSNNKKAIQEVSNNFPQVIQNKSKQNQNESEKLNIQLFNHLLNLNSTQKFDILFLFHSYDLKNSNSNLLSHFYSKSQNETAKTRLALGYYTGNQTLQCRRFEFNRFSNVRYSKTNKFNDITEIKAEILNLDWDYKSHKIVINIIEDTFFQKYIYDYNSKFFSLNDPIGKQIKYKNISFVKEKLGVSTITLSILDRLLSEAFLLKVTTETVRVFYLKELYFLKRNLFLTYDQYKKSRKEKVFSNEQNQMKFEVIYESFTKEDDVLSYFKSKEKFNAFLELKIDVVEPTRNLFLRCGHLIDAYSSNQIWFESLEDDSSYKRILDIHLIAELLVKQFKAKCSSVSIDIVKMGRFVNESKQYLSISTNINLINGEIIYPSQSIIEAIGAFTHFTYEKTNKALVVIDLRTFHVSDKKYIITEPVVFSTIPDRFGSSDLGLKGIENFKSEHECNSICKELKLKNFNSFK